MECNTVKTYKDFSIPPDITLRSIGKCVYCNDDTSPDLLTGEHVIPLSFGGYRIIGKSSCAKCRDITAAIEGKVCSSMFRAMRVHQSVRTRRPRDRTATLKIIEGSVPDGSPIRDVPTEDAPGFVPFPELYPPKILTGSASSADINVSQMFMCPTTGDAAMRQQKLIEEGLAGALAYSSIEIGSFLRVLAKIAYCYAVSQVGLDAFDPLLQGCILGNDEKVSEYVGGLGALNDISPVTADIMEIHSVAPLVIQRAGVNYICAQIRLFRYLQPTPPAYLIVIGCLRNYSGTINQIVY